MCERNINYIPFEDFVNNSGVKAKTIKKNYRRIPGVSKEESGFCVISGTRYPYNLRRTNVEDSAAKRYALLKAISKYKYISHRELRVEPEQFQRMLRDLLSVGYIQKNNLSNTYGANAYDCSPQGDEFIASKKRDAAQELANTVAMCSGTFVGAIISQVYVA